MCIIKIVGILAVSILTGCAYKQIQQSVPSKQQTNFDEADIQRQEAALLDIAIPPYQTRLPICCEDPYSGKVVLGYHSDCTPEDQCRFLHEQMERLGWMLRREFKGSELFLEFEKPTRSCAYSVRPKKNGTEIVLYFEDSGVVY